MLRRILGGVAFAALFAARANAQVPPIATSFTLDNDLGTSVYGTAEFGAFNGFHGHLNFPTATPSFQVWCVDEAHVSKPGVTYNAFVTSFNTTTFADTRQSSGVVTQKFYNALGVLTGTNVVSAQTAYREAAYLTQLMVGVDEGHFPSADGATANPYIQYAIWELMGYTFNSTDEPNYFGNAAAIDTYETMAMTGYLGININDWVIITDSGSGIEQEFIANISFPKETGVPEPATMAMLATGLVGMAGASLRRRRK